MTRKEITLIIRVAVKTPNGSILNKTYMGVTAQIDPTTHVLQLFDRKKRLISEYPANSYHFWQRASTLQLPLSRAAKLLASPGV
jgi:hypothetical protein